MLGEVFGRYRIDARLGAGGMGEVKIDEADREGHAVPFIAMEFVEGRTLAERILEGPLAPAEALDVAGQVASALEAAHVAYMSPEQARGQEVDARTDVFSLGVLLFEALSGKRPFEGANVVETLDRLLHADPPPLARAAPGISPELEAVVSKMLEKDRERRTPTMREARRDLEALAHGAARTVSGAASSGGTAGPANAVAVLAFSNITKRPEDDWLGTGIMETVTADLKGVTGLAVIGCERVCEVEKRLTGRASHGESELAARLGREIGARWVVTGGFQRLGDRLRITARASEVESGEVLTTVKVDGGMSDLFDLQDRIVKDLAEGFHGVRAEFRAPRYAPPMVRLSPRVLLAAAFALLPAPFAPAVELSVPGRLPTGEMLLPNGRLLTPTGTQTQVAPYPFAVALTPDGSRVVVACSGADDQSLYLLDAATGKELAKKPVKKSWLGLAISPDGAHAYLAGAGGRNVLVFGLERDRLVPEEPLSLRRSADAPNADATPSGLAGTADGRSLWAARILLNDLVRVDLVSREVVAEVPVGVHPYRPVLSPDGAILAVANWGASTVSLVDTASGGVVGTVKTADHPSDLVFSRDGRTLFVAQSNRNVVAAVDVASRSVVRQISVGLGPDGPGTPSADALPDGSTPNALALSPDGGTLYVANADDDAVAVLDVGGDLRAARTKGFIPSGWYPSALALSSDGKTLWVANAKGGWSWANAVGGPEPSKKDRDAWKKTRTIPGSVSRVDVPSPKMLAALTARAYANRRPAARGAAPVRASVVVPAAPGGVSPIKHVVYVIRENRTYDQVLGDLPGGNGDPSLAIFGRDVTPNAHALAEEFVLLDNLYCDAEVSADGHNWSMGAYATDFVEKVWPPMYGNKGFSYVFEGNDANAFPTHGYLWDAAARAGLTLRNYGEFVGVSAEWSSTKLSLEEGAEGALKGHTCPFYPGFDLDILDNARVDVFLKEFRGFVKAKEMPRLTIVRLGNDHTAGTKKGERTPRAMVAENDVALGRLVEAISRSPFWKETAIFVIEDDAQNGSDHVDAHRTVGFVISPFTRRKGAVDSTMYSTVSMLRTMELLLGLPPLSQHDAGATPMTAAFADTPDLAPFTHRETKIPFYETNPDGAPLQAESNAWDFSREDAAPDLALNVAIWKSVRGPDAEMPAPVNASWVRLREKAGD